MYFPLGSLTYLTLVLSFALYCMSLWITASAPVRKTIGQLPNEQDFMSYNFFGIKKFLEKKKSCASGKKIIIRKRLNINMRGNISDLN